MLLSRQGLLDQQAAPLLWFDAGQITGLSDGAAVATWPELIRGRNATQATGSKQPILKASVAALNNKAAVRFDGTDDFLQTAAFTTIAQPVVMYVVYVVTTNNAGVNQVIADGTTASSSRVEFLKQSTLDKIAFFAGTANLADGVVSAGTAQVAQCFASGASSTIRVNGVETSGTNPGTAGIDGMTLGAVRTGLTLFTACDIAEVRVYGAGTGLGTIAGRRTLVEAELAAKYGITLP